MTVNIVRKNQAQSNSLWNQLSDSELLARNFNVDDPEQLDHLLSSIPANDEVPSVEFQYHTPGGRSAFVYCAHCNERTHNHGFVMKYQNGNRILVGRDCGKKLYGLNFNTAYNDFKAAQNRAFELKRKMALLNLEVDFCAALNDLLNNPAVRQYEGVRRDFLKVFAGLTRDLQNSASRENGQLNRLEKVRDREAEETREEDAERQIQEASKFGKSKRKSLVNAGQIPSTKRKLKPIFKYSSVPIGRVSGLDIVLPLHPPSVLILDLQNRVAGFFKQLKEQSETIKLSLLFKNFEQILIGLNAQIDRLCLLPLLFQPQNLGTLERWAADQLKHGDTIKVVGNVINRFDSISESELQCKFISDYVPPSADFLESIREAGSFTRFK
jgi:hypothetical protein